MKFLVTGGAGYIGSHMVKYLQDRNFIVDVIDNFSTGNKWALNNCNIFEIDLLDKIALDNVFSHNKYDAVFHFAAKSIVGESFIHEKEYLKNNVDGSKNLLEVIIQYNIKNIIFSSSASVFGSIDSNKISENHPKFPISPYGKSKLIFEEILREKVGEFNLNVVILRYFNAAGADNSGLIGEYHDPETHLIPSIFNNLLGNNNILKIYGDDHKTKDGTCIRDYIHVSDLVHAHYLAFEKMIRDKGCSDYNLGNSNGFSVLEIIKACELITKKKVNYEFIEKRKGEPAYLVADSSKANSELKWITKHSDIENIIRSTWNWHNYFNKYLI
jgi:UDP-glucose 4-epimerase